MAFLCPARIRSKIRKKSRGRKDPPPPLPGRITGSDSIDTLVRVGLEKEDFYRSDDSERQKMTILHDFVPCVEDELSVKRGETVSILYQENDWVYVIGQGGREGFIPFVYCVPMGNSIDELHSSRKRLINNNIPNFNHPTGRQLSDLVEEEDEISVASASTLNRHKSRSLPSIKEVGLPSIGPYEETEVSSQAPLLGLQPETNHRTFEIPPNWPRYENLIDLSRPDQGHVNSVATIEVVDVRSFDKADSGKYIALFPFRAIEEGDIDIDRGDFVTVLNRDDPDWFWVAKSNGAEGFVPGNFMCPSEGANTTAKLEQQTATSTGSSAASVCSSQTAHPATTELVVLYDYTAKAPDDISVMRGEWVYADLSDQPEKDWLWVYAQATSKFGFIPKEFAKPPGIIRNTTTRRSNVEKNLVRSSARPGALKRTMSLSERRNQPFDPYLSP